jgi:hypothetical protein
LFYSTGRRNKRIVLTSLLDLAIDRKKGSDLVPRPSPGRVGESIRLRRRGPLA